MKTIIKCYFLCTILIDKKDLKVVSYIPSFNIDESLAFKYISIQK